jgi:hypothetical protein
MCCCSTCPPKLCYLAFDDLLEKASLRRDSKTIENLDVCVELGIFKTRLNHFIAAALAPMKIYKSLSLAPRLCLSLLTSHLLKNSLKTMIRRDYVCFLPSSFKNSTFNLMGSKTGWCSTCVESESSKSLPREWMVGLLVAQRDV